MDQSWFEMRDIRKKNVESAVWIPLRLNQTLESSGQPGHLGYHAEFHGLTSLAIPVTHSDAAFALEWMDVGLRFTHHAGMVDGEYRSADEYRDYRSDLVGLCLVLAQDGNSVDPPEWHLHQDLVIALELKREQDTWVAMSEGYVEVVRLMRQDGRPSALLMRTRGSTTRDPFHCCTIPGH